MIGPLSRENSSDEQTKGAAYSMPWRVTAAICLALGILLASAPYLGSRVSASGQLFTYSDFSSTSGLQLNGTAVQTTDSANAQVIRLAPASTIGAAGSAFATLPVSTLISFHSRFQFQIKDGSGADGMAFVIQHVPSGTGALGGGGGGLGFAGITNSVGVEFDTFQNYFDVNNNHVAILTDGNMVDVKYATPTFDIRGGLRTAWVDYDAALHVLNVFLSTDSTKPLSPLLSYTIDISSFVGNVAYVGFTAATGGLTDNHDVLNWTFEGSTADLRGATLTGGNLSGANMSGMDLTGANLSGANLTNANLAGAIMTGVIVDGVIWNNTTCPDGTNSSNNSGRTCVGHLLLDTTPPVTVASLSPAANGAGWNNSKVVITLAAADSEPGGTGMAATYFTIDNPACGGPSGSTLGCSVYNSTSPPVITSEGMHTVYFFSVDGAGNAEPQKSQVVKLDLTAPTVTFSGNAASYTVDQTVAITCAAIDPLSNGVASGIDQGKTTCPTASAPAYSINVKNVNGSSGINTLVGTATDNAGNTGTGSASFTVVVTSSSLCNLTWQFIHGSAPYQSLPIPSTALATVNQLVSTACGYLSSAQAALTSVQKTAAITAYQQAVTALVSPGWLTQSQATILVTLSTGL